MPQEAGKQPRPTIDDFDIKEFVKASFDGAINDDSPFETVKQAEESILAALVHRFGRLSQVNRDRAGMFVAFEWNNRTADANERMWERWAERRAESGHVA